MSRPTDPSGQGKGRLNVSLRKEEIRNRFRKSGLRQGWWKSEKPVIAAVSGGGDSVALLWMLTTFWGGQVIVAHLEHGIRGKGSLRDARFVEKLAQNWQLKFAIAHRNVPREKKKGESLEDCARRVRYDFFEKTRRETGAEWVLLGHNANDIAETMLFHLLRGTGLRGLVGIPETRSCFARPLVDFQRDELRSILLSHHIPWVEDETNADERYTRNFLRNNLIPLIRKHVNPSAEKHLSALSREVSELVREQETETRRALLSLRTSFPLSNVTWVQSQAENMKLSILCHCIRQEGREQALPVLSRERTLELANLIRKGGRWCFQWKEDFEVCCGRGLIGWRERPSGDKESTILIQTPEGEIRWGGWTIRWVLQKHSPLAHETHAEMGNFDVAFPPSLPTTLVIHSLSQEAMQRIRFPQIPWWAEKGWPVLHLGSTMSWSPDPGLPEENRPAPAERGEWLRLSLAPNKETTERE